MMMITYFVMCASIALSTIHCLPVNNGIVSRVIYSEASDICSSRERWLVASVIKNRIKHKGFGNGKLKSMKDVVKQKNAFSCIGDKRNTNWKRSLTLTQKNKAFNLALKLSIVNFQPYPSIVYYHDKSIKKPKSWDNRYWKAIKVIETKHFIFYRVVPSKGK